MNGMVSDRNEEECKPEKTKQQQKAHKKKKLTSLEMKLLLKNTSISRKSV